MLGIIGDLHNVFSEQIPSLSLPAAGLVVKVDNMLDRRVIRYFLVTISYDSSVKNTLCGLGKISV